MSKNFRLGRRQIEMTDTDTIYQLAGPCRQKPSKLNLCYSCEQTNLKTVEPIYCQFCGNPNCPTCVLKERNFPKARLNDEGKKPRGKICSVCDHKFLIRQLLLEDIVSLQKSKQQTKMLEDKLQQLK